MMFTIYHRPTDVPGAEYVVRAFQVSQDGARPTRWVRTSDTLDGARGLLPATADSRFGRSDDDDPTIVETWL